jgi:ribosomal protein S2
MNKYVYAKKGNGVHMFDIQKQLEKIRVAAHIIASIPDPSTITV